MALHSPAAKRQQGPSMGGGTPGGLKVGGGFASSMKVTGDEIYLWILVFAEVGAIAWLRHAFRRYHGG
jgi:hypothetical protein